MFVGPKHSEKLTRLQWQWIIFMFYTQIFKTSSDLNHHCEVTELWKYPNKYFYSLRNFPGTHSGIYVTSISNQ